MKAKGNGHPALCAHNILRCVQGEVPYERLKGFDPKLIDLPTQEASVKARQHIDWLIEHLEPRVNAGGFSITPDTTGAER